tara:strand:+ start:108 stop:374 length:267 start_codon:yes stop_codon:yes gene_type:complete
MINRVDAIRELYSGQYHKATADEIVWKDGHTTTDEENANIDTKLSELQIIENRKNEYPSIEECVHAILDDTLNDLQAKRQAVKEKFPK